MVTLFRPQPIRVTQGIIQSGYTWLETIVLVDDKEMERLGDWTLGFYHCRHCNAFQGFAYHVPPKNGPQVVSPQMHNERNAFWRQHAHGDGRIVLFERDIPSAEPIVAADAATVPQEPAGTDDPPRH